jgi:glycine/D-amino acid oxidase-like deaminating enzyme
MMRVIVLGAGIIGAAVACELAAVGVDVIIVEADVPAGGTSGNSGAWINSNNKRPRSYHDFSMRAMEEWRRLAAELDWPGWYVPTGNVTWAETEQQRADLADRIARLRQWTYPVDELTRGDLDRLEPELRVPANAQIAFFPSEGFVHTHQAIKALLARAQAGGARLILAQGSAVLESSGQRVDAIRLPGGEPLRADAYLCCVGWRTPHLLEPLGVRVPLVPADRQGSSAPCLIARVPTARQLVGRVINASGLFLRPEWQGALHLEAEAANARVGMHTSQAALEAYGIELVDGARRVLPTLPEAPVETGLCVRPLPVDGMPIVGWLPQFDNVYLMVGHSGVTLAPLLARLAVAEVTRGPILDLEAYRISRFSSTDDRPT